MTGKYDFATQVTPPSGGEAMDPIGMAYALVEQLGLKLEQKKSPVEVLVIDHMERPSEN